jgi:hypothetical protein
MTAVIYPCKRCGSNFIDLTSLEKHQATTCKDKKWKIDDEGHKYHNDLQD